MKLLKKVTKTKKEFHWSGMHPLFYDPFISFFIPSDLGDKVIADIGCGKGINAYIAQSTKYIKGATFIGIDTNADNLDFCKKHRIYDKNISKKIPPIPLKDKTDDLLLCTEVIEHLSQKKGLELLNEIDRVCKGRAIVSTPNIFYPNPPNEEEDKHLSLWTAKDFHKMGYKVHGLGLKVPLVNTDSFYLLKQGLYYALTPVSYIFPKISGFLLCYKDY